MLVGNFVWYLGEFGGDASASMWYLRGVVAHWAAHAESSTSVHSGEGQGEEVFFTPGDPAEARGVAGFACTRAAGFVH